MRILTVVGARPQFIKATPVSKELRKWGHEEVLVHTGQHYDHGMSRIFFEEMGIPEPDLNLGVGSGPHGWQTGQMLMAIEEVISARRPDVVLVYGDTNSTLAGALAAAKLHVRLAHVEAGLRSYNRDMPEEHNRVLTDHCADLLFCPTRTAVNNLAAEGILRGVHLVGDTMLDALLQFAPLARDKSSLLRELSLEPKKYVLATVHRAYNTDVETNLQNIFSALSRLEETVVFPLHPRTRLRANHITQGYVRSNIMLLDPVGYLDMLALEHDARVIITDSGGVQKEAYFFKVPCVTLRPETEWVETVEAGWNVLAATEPAAIVNAVRSLQAGNGSVDAVFGEGHASERIREILETLGEQ